MITSDATLHAPCPACRSRSGRSGTNAALATVLVAVLAAPLAAQGAGGATPVVPAAAGQGTVAGSLVLGRVIALQLDHVPVRAALDTIAARGRLRLTYSPRRLPADKMVTIAADRITISDAFAAVLDGTGLAVFIAETGRVVVAPVASGAASPMARIDRGRVRQAAGSIAGRVTDAVTYTPLDQVAVRVEGPGLGTVTTRDGRYAIHNIPPGTYRVIARRVGYTPLTKTVTVAADSTTTADLALAAAPTRLNEMVTTAVGDQRRYEVGNVISTINVDSIAPTAPVTSLTDLISARAPGVEVLETSGMTGSGEAIRIRGLSSLVLQNDPILIIDGVRQDNSPGGDISSYFSGNGTHPTPTRLNDIDFSNVESIDILKGPSASTEYGTDAANGVIVITTKRGTAGRPQWKVSGEQTASGIPVSFPEGYYSWGHTLDSARTTVNCRLVTAFSFQYGQYGSPAGNCAVDSVSRWNPLNHSATTIFGTGSRGKYDASVSGGSDAVRYFVAGGLSNENGAIQMPPVFRHLADTAGIALPRAALNPNSQEQRSARVNAAITLSPTVDLTAMANYLSTYQQTPDAAYLYYGAFFSPALSGPAHYYGYGYYNGSLSSFTPLGELSATGSQNTNRVTGGLTGNWHPAAWLAVHATAGLDHGAQRNEELNYPLTNAPSLHTQPSLGIADATTDVYSVDLRGTATASLTRNVRMTMSGGLQMVDTRIAGQTAFAQHITVTNLTLNGATGPTVGQLANRQATLGGYGEEQISLGDRLFLTGALRVDAGSGFGGAYSTAAYPKASVSWLAISQGPAVVRVRGAFGESGVQPTNGAALQLYVPGTTYSGGATGATYALGWPGNASLRPERSTEFEGGADLSGWGNRLSAELTAYSKTTSDALVNVSLGELGNYPYQENIGEVRNTGVEGSAVVGVVRGRAVTWDMAANASLNHNTLVSLAPGVAAQTLDGYARAFQYRQAPGYPLYGLWAQRVTYTDANHNGIIEPIEVALADSASYVGPSLPTCEASVSTHLGLWRSAVTVGALVDYRGGYRIGNVMAAYTDIIGNTRATNEPTAPLWLQARAVENEQGHFTNALNDEDGSFVRVREVSVTYAIPRSVARAVRAQNVSVTAAVRNLALWTRYTAVDPEVSNSAGTNIQNAPSLGGNVVNNDVRANFGGVPLLRYWVVRLNAGW